MTRHIVAGTLAAALAVGLSSVLLAQAGAGTVGGSATRAADKPYSNYNVQLMDTATRQVVATVPLDTQGKYLFMNVGSDKRYLVQLFNTPQNRVVCTEDVTLTPQRANRTDVNISCSKPVWPWLVGAAAGVPVIAVVATQSSSQ